MEIQQTKNEKITGSGSGKLDIGQSGEITVKNE